MAGSFISPNDLQAAAIEHALDGIAPLTTTEWELCVNFWAFNISGAEVEVCLLMARLFDCPLLDTVIEEIARYQIASKQQKEEN